MNPILLILALLLLSACAPDGAADQAAARGSLDADSGDRPLACSAPERVAILPDGIGEASGIAPSRSHPGVFWVNNDSEGDPVLYALDANGALIARVALTSPHPQRDWEDLAAAPCGELDCIYIADIGDNLHDRDDIAILRLAEPAPRDGEASGIERFPIRFPDGAHDAEAMFVLPDESVHIITKGRDGPVAVYRYPGSLRPELVTLDRVQYLTDGLAQLPDLVTGAASSPDGRIIAVRTYSRVTMYTMDADTLRPVGGADLSGAGEPQGEGISVSADGTMTLVSEVGPLGGEPPFSRLRCRVP